MVICIKKKIWNRSRMKPAAGNRKKPQGQQYEMQHRGIYRIFHGSEEISVKNGAWILEESVSLFHGKTNPIRYFSSDELNNMNVEKHWTFRDGDYEWCHASWEGRLVLVKLPFRMMIDPACSKEIRLRLLREIVVATQMTTHNNVHKLLGCCLETEFPVLVYEWVTSNTLGDRISLKDTALEWKDRLRIAWEMCHAVSYLHTAFLRPIIHRDLRLNNVFLDHDQAAKLCNFSLSISIPEGEDFVELDQIIGTTSYMAGTRSCMAPEYAMHGIVAESVDVYSFGVLFLILLTGKTPIFLGEENDEQNELVTWVRNCIKENCIGKIVDPRITKYGVTTIEDRQLRESIHLALLCIAEEADRRPTMVNAATRLKIMINSPESISTSIRFQGELIYKIFRGTAENYLEHKALLQEKLNFLFQYGTVNDPIHYLSIDEINSMKVEYGLFSWDWDRDCAWYQGSWDGRAVLIKLQKRMIEGLSSTSKIRWRLLHEISYNIRLRLLCETVVAAQMASQKNVQKLLGCCLETEYPVLVYERVIAESLKDRIIQREKDQNKLPVLEWENRLRIAWEISQVVSYMHTAFPRPIIHRYLEPENIFLDRDNTVKLSSFIPVYIPEGEEFVVDDYIIGTRDYMAPEYHQHREVAECADVYSFGMLLLFLLTGRDASFPCTEIEEENYVKLVDWVSKEFRKECIITIVDPVIAKNGVTISELSAYLNLALRCTEAKKDSRPTMVDVATELNNMINSTEYMPSTSNCLM